jgi:hypothetical protein
VADSITDEELLRAVMEYFGDDLHVAMPARVTKYDAEAQTVEVEPQFKRQLARDVAEKLPVISNVPVQFPRGGGFFSTVPIQKDDFVLLVFTDQPLGAWRSKGEPTEPGDRRAHTLSGAVAIPGVYPIAGKLQSTSTDAMLMGKDGTAAAQIKITSSGGELGAGASKEIARKGDGVKIANPGALLTWMQAVETFINGLVPGTIATLAAAIAAAPGLEIKDGSSKWKAVD